MFISVIVTCYNLDRYIAEALTSVVNQNFDSSLYEIILVDDCSTDRSAEIASAFKSVRYIKTSENSGVLLATIFGIQHAKGDIIAFLDGDDVWRSDKLARISTRFFDDSSLVFLTHNYEFIDEKGKPTRGQEYTQKIYSQLNDSDQISQLIIDGILHRRNYVWLGSAYSIRLKTEDINAFVDWVATLTSPQLTYQDWPLAFWIAASSSGRFGYDCEKLFSYRVHSTNYSGDSKSLEKAIRNWSKAYNTSVCLLRIAEIFSCDETVKSACESGVMRDNLILKLFEDPFKFSVIELFLHLNSFGSLRRKLTELTRVFVVKFLGIKLYLALKNFKQRIDFFHI